MKKIFIFLTVLGVLTTPVFALADSYGFDTAAGKAIPKTVAGSTTAPEIIGKIVGVGLSMLGVIFFLLILYAGFLWMTAMGDKGKIDQSKSILETAAVGLMIVLASYAIATFLFSNIAGSGTGSSTSTTGNTPPASGFAGYCCIDNRSCQPDGGDQSCGGVGPAYHYDTLVQCNQLCGP
jgi:hypothetical protein